MCRGGFGRGAARRCVVASRSGSVFSPTHNFAKLVSSDMEDDRLACERAAASFPVRELTFYLDGGPDGEDGAA